MIGVLIAGIGLVVAGLLAIGFGIPVKEFSFGNTLILAGAIGGLHRRDHVRACGWRCGN